MNGSLLVRSAAAYWQRKAVTIVLLLISTITHAEDQLIRDQQYNYAGGLIDFSIDKQSEQIPVVNFGLHQPAIIDAGKRWRVLLGIDLNTLPGDYVIFVHHADTGVPASTYRFEVRPRNYPLIEPIASSDAWTAFRFDTFSEIDFANSEAPALPLRPPANGTWQDFFARVPLRDDDSDTSRQHLAHRALLVKRIAVVSAPQNGLVSRIVQHADPQLGLSVFIDHGRGLFSVLSGLSDLDIEVGNGVVAGAALGRVVADQQRSNVPAERWLVWQTVLNRAYVDPQILTSIRLDTGS